MSKRTVEQVKNEALEQYTSEEITGEDVKRLASLVGFGLTNEQIAFVIASTEDDVSDADWAKLLTEMYVRGEQATVDMAWELTGFDGTEDDSKAMQAYIDAFKEANGRVPNLPPNKLWSILTDPETKTNCETADDWNEVIENAEPEDDETTEVKPTPTFDASAADKAMDAAHKMADMIASNAEFEETLGKVIEYNSFLKVAPLMLMHQIEKMVGADGMLAAPIPGSISMDETGKETFLPMVGNTLYDIYKVTSGKKQKRMSYFANLFGFLPQGAQWKEELKKIALGKDGPYAPQNGYNEKKLERMKMDAERKIRDGGDAVRKAFKLQHTFQWLKEFKGAHIEILQDAEGNIERTAQPFWVCPLRADGTPNLLEGASYSIGEVLQFDRAKTEAKGNNYKALLESRKRKSPPPAPAATTATTTQPKAEALDVALIKDMRQLDSYTAVFGHFALDTMQEQFQGSDFEKAFNTKLATDDAFVESFDHISKLCDAIKGRLTVRMRAIEAKRIQATGNGAIMMPTATVVA